MLARQLLRDDARPAGERSEHVQDDVETIVASGLFQLDLYQRQVGRTLDLAEAVLDYVTNGERAGLQPHLLFLPPHAAARLAASGEGQPEGRAASVFAAYLRRPELDIDPHPLFDAARFRRMSGIGEGMCALAAYEERLREDADCPSPCLLFDRAHYDTRGDASDGLQHYLSQGWREGRSPHPLFDASRWRAAADRLRVSVPRDVNPLLTYHSDPATWVLATCTLFDPEALAAQLAERGLAPAADRPPLADLLDRAEILSGHRMFDPDFYAAQAQALGLVLTEHPLLHHARNNGRTGIDPHPLFNVRFYLQSYQDVARSSMDPLQHFLRHGRPELRNPNPLMLSKPYAVHVSHDADRSCDDVVRHYMEQGGPSLVDPHPLFEAALYAARHPACLLRGDTPLTHYAREWRSRGVEFPPWGTALAERRGQATGTANVDLIVVSHELTRTGAPLILLGLVREFVSRLGLGCLVVAVRGGELRDAFLEWAPVLDLAAVKQAASSLDDFVASLVTSLGRGGQRAVLVNTACVADLGASFAATGLPVVTLVHELPAAFDVSTFQRVYQASRLVVYPAAFVRSEAHKSFPLDIDRTVVIPQGLLDEAFGTGDADAARQAVLRELAAPADAFVVLGCGTRDLRKGIDLFAGMASAAIARQAAEEEPGRPLYFLWVGGGEGPPHSPFWHVERDLAASGLAARVRFIGARSRSEPFFLGCDAFALTSRLDPFPCVVHEAMACRKPVVAFDRAGGAPEALAGGGGAVVAYGDVAAMAATILAWAGDAASAASTGACAEAIVRSRYRFPAYANRILDELSRVGGPRAAASGGSRAPQSRDRVLVASPELSDEAACRTAADLVRGLVRRGLDAELLLTGARPPAGPLPFLRDLPLRVLARTFRQRTTYADAWSHLRLALETTTPAVLAAGADDLASALAPALPAGASALGSIPDDHPSTAERVIRLGRYWHRAVAATPELQAWAIRLSPSLDGRCVVIPPAVLLRDAAHLGASSVPLRIACASGRLGSTLPIRIVEDLVDCLAGAPAMLTVIGVDAAVAMVSPVFASLVAAGRLALLPPVSGPALDEALQGCQVLVLPGAPFTQDLSAPLQAMSAGLAVIRFGGGGERDWLAHERTGLAVAPGDRRGLVRTVAGLAADPSRLVRLREGAQAYGRSLTTDPETSHDLYADLLSEMLQELREGHFVAPAPPLLHPDLGALSLAPSQIVHPDRIPPGRRS